MSEVPEQDLLKGDEEFTPEGRGGAVKMDDLAPCYFLSVKCINWYTYYKYNKILQREYKTRNTLDILIHI